MHVPKAMTEKTVLWEIIEVFDNFFKYLTKILLGDFNATLVEKGYFQIDNWE